MPICMYVYVRMFACIKKNACIQAYVHAYIYVCVCACIFVFIPMHATTASHVLFLK